MTKPKLERPRVVIVSRSIVFNKEGKFLLIQREANDSHNPNMWEFPGDIAEPPGNIVLLRS